MSQSKSSQPGEVSIYDEEKVGLDQIVDEVVTIPRTKNGEVTLSRHGIYKLCQRGYTIRDVSGIFGVDELTLKKYFEREIFCGKASLSATLKVHLLREALREKPNPTIFLMALKCWAGINDDGLKQDDVEQTKSTQWNVEVKVVQKPTALTESERAELEDAE